MSNLEAFAGPEKCNWMDPIKVVYDLFTKTNSTFLKKSIQLNSNSGPSKFNLE